MIDSLTTGEIGDEITIFVHGNGEQSIFLHIFRFTLQLETNVAKFSNGIMYVYAWVVHSFDLNQVSQYSASKFSLNLSLSWYYRDIIVSIVTFHPF